MRRLNSKFEIGGVEIKITPKNFREIERYSAQFAYGHREILLRYMGLPTSTLLLGVLQHWVSAGPDLLRNARMPRVGLWKRSPYWVYSKSGERYLQEHGIKTAKAIGSPWAYLCELNQIVSGKDLKLDSEKFLIFPTHHSLSVHVPISRRQIREKIRFWKNLTKGQPITICLLWTEFLDPNWREICSEEGVELTFAGVSVTNPIWSPHPSRLDFLPSIMKLLQSHTHSIFECPTSAIFYALSMGHSVGYFSETLTFDWESESPAHNEEALWFREEMPTIIGQFADSKHVENLWRDMLGFDAVLSPTDLEQTLMHSLKSVPTQ
jgi:hypothetical protein